MKDLIKALEIFNSYNPNATTHCEHDTFSICGVEPSEVSEDDKEVLEELGFIISNEWGDDMFISFRWGSS